MSRIPNIYVPMYPGAPAHLSGPLRWQDDVSGEMQAAVLTFLDDATHQTEHITPEQLELVRDYCEYYINAPCWETETMQIEFATLRQQIKTRRIFEELNTWMHEALEIGIDPL